MCGVKTCHCPTPFTDFRIIFTFYALFEQHSSECKCKCKLNLTSYKYWHERSDSAVRVRLKGDILKYVHARWRNWAAKIRRFGSTIRRKSDCKEQSHMTRKRCEIGENFQQTSNTNKESGFHKPHLPWLSVIMHNNGYHGTASGDQGSAQGVQYLRKATTRGGVGLRQTERSVWYRDLT